MRRVVPRFAALVAREVLALGRARGPFLLRVACGAAAAAVVLPMIHGRGGRHMALAAERAFEAVVVVQCLLALLLGAVLGVFSIATERRDHTLGLLVLSRFRSGEVVLAKIAALVGLLSMVLLAALPVYGLLGWAGGMDYVWLGRLAFLTVVLGAVATAMGLFVSLRLPNALGATALALALLALILVAIPRAANGVHRDSRWSQRLLPLKSVQVVALQGKPPPNPNPYRHGPRQAGPPPRRPARQTYYGGLALLGALAVLLALLAVRSVQGGAARRPGRGLRGLFERADAFFERLNVGDVRFGEGRRAPPLRGNPVAWLARTGKGVGLAHNALRLAAGMVGLAFLFGTWLIFRLAEHDYMDGVPGPLLGGLGVALLLGLSLGAGTFAGERQGKTLAVLASTPLTAWTILRGKARAFARAFALLFVLPAALVAALVGVASYEDLKPVLDVLLVLAGEGVCAYALAAACSLFFASPLRAGVTALFLWVAANVVPPLSLGAFVYGLEGGTTGAIVAGVLLLLVTVVFVLLGLHAWRRRRPALGLAALLGAALPGVGIFAGVLADLGLTPERVIDAAEKTVGTLCLGWAGAPSGEAVLGVLFLLALAVALLLYTGRVTDRALGRSR